MKNNDILSIVNKFLRKYFNAKTTKQIIEFIKHYFIGLWIKIDEHHLFLAGGGIAFSLLLSIVPFIMLSLSILGTFVDPGVIEEKIIFTIDTIIPYPEYANYAKQIISTKLPSVIEYKGFAAYFGIIGLLFTSTWIFSSLRTVLNQIFFIKTNETAIRGMIKDFKMVFLLLILIFISTFAVPLLNFIVLATNEIPVLSYLKISYVLNSIISYSATGIIFLMFYVFYSLIPHEKLEQKVALVSAIWATVLWDLARKLFGFYVSNFLADNQFYGAFVLVMVVLFWIFYSSCLFIIGAEIGQLYRERKTHNVKKPNEKTSKPNSI
ncbi:MAG: hypothetical protein CO129_06685 [Ignavibacteriales bacterium CG_4_9_14_3_um_filter_34_10]|nr:MAG: hypothetical protein CO129_06685 [Ignavibacteriales bacterium CG_4_9_14_3_um_filter_34_10]